MVAREARELYEKVCNDPDSVTLPQEVRDYLDYSIRSVIINHGLRHLELKFKSSEVDFIKMSDFTFLYLKCNSDKVVKYLRTQGYIVDVSNTGNVCSIHIEW